MVLGHKEKQNLKALRKFRGDFLSPVLFYWNLYENDYFSIEA